ncbi:hypothetical protein [Motiliproteus sp.]|uniref:hypothetical protein n=1 Tax=Motiliproteus sp. TaxID=1898955 RepID=UPI003BA85755
MFSKKSDLKYCPLLKKPCIGNECMFATRLSGKDPRTGQDVDDEFCAVAALPMLLTESIKAQHQTGAAVESFRNETIKTHTQVLAATASGQLIPAKRLEG